MKMKPPKSAAGGSYNGQKITDAAIEVGPIDVAGFLQAGWTKATTDRKQNKKPKAAAVENAEPPKKEES